MQETFGHGFGFVVWWNKHRVGVRKITSHSRLDDICDSANGGFALAMMDRPSDRFVTRCRKNADTVQGIR